MFDVVSKVASNLVTNGISRLVLGEDDPSVPEVDAVESDDSSPFDSVLKAYLPAEDSANVSEEELFSAAVAQRVHSLKGEEGQSAYTAALDAEKLALTTSNGYVPLEQASINALKKLVADGVITQEEGDLIYTESFNAAQLDDDKNNLFDGRGDANDPTVAIAQMSEAMSKIKLYLDSLAETPVAKESLLSLVSASATGAGAAAATLGKSAVVGGASDSGHVVPNGTHVDGSEGFLFKPVSHNQGTLAILMAQEYTYNVASIRLLDAAGNLIEDGVRMPDGISETGREKFGFSKQGGSYQKNLTVEVKFHDGSIKTYEIADPSQRYD